MTASRNPDKKTKKQQKTGGGMDEELREVMKGRDQGAPVTRVFAIEGFLRNQYIKREKKVFCPQDPVFIIF